MDEIIQIYEQTFGSPGDVDEFGVSQVDQSDWRTILKMIQAGMSEEQIKEQMAMNTMKNRVREDVEKVEAFAPEGEQLAYINREEADILKLMGGSGEREPITGVESFRNAYVSGQNSALGADASKDFTPREQKQFQAAQDEKAYQTEASGGDVGNYNYTSSTVEKQADRASQHHERTGQKETIQDYGDKDLLEQIAADQSKREVAGKDGTGITDFISKHPYLKTMDMFAGGVADLEEWQVKRFLEGNIGDTDVGMGNLLAKLRDNPQEFGDWFAKRGDIFDEVFEKELESKEGQEEKELSDQEKFDFLVNKYSGSKQFNKTYNPKEYFKSEPGESTADYQKRMGGKGVTAAELAQAQAEGKLDFTRANTAMIEEGRKRLEEDRQGGIVKRSGKGGGGPVEQVTEEEEVVTETDPRAGAFNVGGTMPYTHDVATGGTQMDVPLGRRFQVDKTGKYLGSDKRSLEDMYKYATLGGHEQLEPFQQYLARRREHLDEDEPQYFDEEGNVIYSNGVT